jgi:hypothetical protein
MPAKQKKRGFGGTGFHAMNEIVESSRLAGLEDFLCSLDSSLRLSGLFHAAGRDRRTADFTSSTLMP